VLENFRLNVGKKYARIRFRRKTEPVVRFTDILSRSRRALVIFPESGLDGDSTQLVLKYLSRRFSSGSLLLLIRDDVANTLTTSSMVKTVTYSREEINAWFLPRASLLRKLKTSTFDVVFDLNMALALPSAFICRETNALLRIGFAKESGDEFYNLQVRTTSSSNLPNAYRTLLKCLEMF
jgi:hypothetical protein